MYVEHPVCDGQLRGRLLLRLALCGALPGVQRGEEEYGSQRRMRQCGCGHRPGQRMRDRRCEHVQADRLLQRAGDVQAVPERHDVCEQCVRKRAADTVYVRRAGHVQGGRCERVCSLCMRKRDSVRRDVYE